MLGGGDPQGGSEAVIEPVEPKTNPAKISVLIIAKNAGTLLRECVQSVRWAHEVVVIVDDSSDDDTEEVAREIADLVAVRKFDDFASQRNAALDLASGDWVFAIDCDERATVELAAEIRSVTTRDHSSETQNHTNEIARYNGYRIPIQSVILGRGFGYSGTQCDLPLRLFRRDQGRWKGKVHETVAIEGPIGTLKNAIRHQTIPDMRTFLEKLNHYTTLEAKARFAAGIRPSGVELALRPVWTFLKLYLLKQGFRDGTEGFVFCAMSGVSVAARHWKHRELARSGGST
jgi:glycosyltransferase involved in cell wall biosynthesis